MNNITNKDIETLRLITEIRATAEKLYYLSIEWQRHSSGNWQVERNTYQGACSEIINDMERIFINKFGFIPNEIYPEYDEPVEKLEVGKSYWAWIQHRDAAGSYDIEVVSREGEKIYARFCGFGEDLIATGTVKVRHSFLQDGRKVTYEYADFTWISDFGLQFDGDIAGCDKVEI